MNVRKSLELTSTNPSVVTLNPVCKSIWLGSICQTTDCPRAHPQRCSNPDCLVMDQGLPRWRVLQCRRWHHNPKPKKKPQKKENHYFPRSASHTKTYWPPLPPNRRAPVFSTGCNQSTIPVWLNHHSPLQNQWSKTNAVHSSSSGNEKATWSTPLPMGGNQVWGNHNLNQKICLAMEIVRLMSPI